ncbi:cysteine desulfurase family protein [Lacibacterium aquatile]|uniref:Cysteine desulfurase n=1 Tax=Lacibacterium aquatile TaxID=1168082 RepID=A0ABW5DLW9_9PROT
MIYLDHNATTPVNPAVAKLVGDVLIEGGNPSSVHGAGRLARRRLEVAREQVALLVGADPRHVLFTASGTEANNQALRGFPGHTILTSAIEHDAVLKSSEGAGRIPVDSLGRIDLEALEKLLDGLSGPVLVSVMLANNETGVVQPVRAVANLVHARGGLLHCDAVQGPGRLPMDIRVLGADLLTLSAHKMGGAPGAAALIFREGAEPAALLRGGGQERSRRAGTENVPAIAGFGLAASLAGESLILMTHVEALRDQLAEDLKARGGVIIAEEAERLPNTLCVALPGKPAETQVMTLDLAGFAVSAGSACSSGKVKRSHVLVAMGLPDEIAGSAIRLSLSPATSADELARFVAAWARMTG